MSHKFKIKSQLSEKQIEKDFSNFLGYMSVLSGEMFRLIDVNEQDTGSDALLSINRPVLPMYIQFKVSEGMEIADRVVPNKHVVIKLISDYRIKNGITDDPILYFKLRDLAKKSVEYQHNVLLKHNGRRSMAFYLAPLTLHRDDFYQSLIANRDFMYWHFWREVRHGSLRQLIELTPGFKNCVSITPHAQVDTSDHHYSYSMTGNNICFHSPEVIMRGVSRFSDNFYRYISMARESGFRSIESLYTEHLRELEIENNIMTLNGYRKYCKDLYEHHNICSYLLMVND